MEVDNLKLSAEERRYFEPLLDNLLSHIIKFMESYQAEEDKIIED